jgi:acyl-coenzyme A thioesterase PaaI-like protein
VRALAGFAFLFMVVASICFGFAGHNMTTNIDRDVLIATGWTPLPAEYFSATIGGTWAKTKSGQRVVGLLAPNEIANRANGPVHGGALMTFADMALSIGVVDALGEPRFAAVEMQYRFLASVPTGSFITCEPEVVRQTSALIFMRGLIKLEEKVVGSIDGLFKIFDATRT